MSKPSAINASTLLATKGAATTPAGLQRGQRPSEALADLNFKVPESFRHHFKQLALDARLKHVQLLVRCVEAWEREQGISENAKTRNG